MTLTAAVAGVGLCTRSVLPLPRERSSGPPMPRTVRITLPLARTNDGGDATSNGPLPLSGVLT